MSPYILYINNVCSRSTGFYSEQNKSPGYTMPRTEQSLSSAPSLLVLQDRAAPATTTTLFAASAAPTTPIPGPSGIAPSIVLLVLLLLPLFLRQRSHVPVQLGNPPIRTLPQPQRLVCYIYAKYTLQIYTPFGPRDCPTRQCEDTKPAPCVAGWDRNALYTLLCQFPSTQKCL